MDPMQVCRDIALDCIEAVMSSRTKRATRRTHRERTSNDSLYMVFRHDSGELRELSSQIHPRTSGQIFDVARDPRYENSSGINSSRRNGEVNRRPCADCTFAKSKCTLLPSNPSLCLRCRSKGRTHCPPHIPYSQRRAHERILALEGSKPLRGTSQEPSFSGPPEPEQTMLSPMLQPIPMPEPIPAANYVEPISVGVPQPQQHQPHPPFGLEAMSPPTAVYPQPHTTAPPEQSAMPNFHCVDFGSYGSSYTRTELPWYPSIPDDSIIFPVPGDIESAGHYQRNDGNHAYWQ